MVKQLLVEKILEQSDRYDWSLQGLGLLRLYFRDKARLHIWDHSFAKPGASFIHDHSWDLKSEVIGGVLTNTRYVEALPWEGLPFWKGRIVAGYNARLIDQKLVYLKRMPVEVYGPGDTYSQKADEIHLTRAYPGTITLMERNQGDPDAQVHVYWPHGTEWGDAKPRAATPEEVKAMTTKALEVLRGI